MKRRTTYITFGLFFLALLAVPLSMIFLPKGKSFYYLVAAQEMLKEGNIPEASVLVKRAVELQPESLMALRGAVSIYLVQGRYDDAQNTLSKLFAISSDFAPAYRDSALIRLHQNDIEGARAAVQKAISLSPESGENYRVLGLIALEEKDTKKAEEQLLKAIELEPDNPNCHYLLGAIYFDQEKYPRAIEELSIAIEKEPDFAPAYAQIGMCYLKTNLQLHALDAYKKAATLDPTDYNSMYNVACIYSLENKPEAAVQWLELAVKNGFSDFEYMKKDTDLDNIRNHPGYIALAKKESKPDSANTKPAPEQQQPKIESGGRGDSGTVLKPAGNV